ncbi:MULTISPECIES: LysM peptidoglycan-binding domain-containing protein [Planktomarina]|jgi:LysM repeat protein|uniref:LysM peptidoglycan-binding domain-containing protein n=1 Tax=Planktomarina TaxID=1284657 RepID=UPI0026F5AC8D|nr:LysM peptidoglycan-binding domain-containing protein [Planktomarina temperata]
MSSIDKKNVTATSRNTAVLVSGVIGLICLWWFYPQIRAAMDPVREVPSAQDAAAPLPSDAGSEPEAAADGETDTAKPPAQDTAAAPDSATAEAAPEETASESSSAEAATDTPAEPLSSQLSAPKFDVVRIEDDGSALIAGQADGRGHVILSVDGVEQAEARADLSGTGQFVIFAFIPSTGDQQSLKLHLYAEDGSGPVVSAQTVFVAPATAAATATDSTAAPVQEEVTVSESPDTAAETDTETEADTETETDTEIETGTGTETASTDVASPEAKADKAPATVILADEDGVRVLQDGAPSAAKPAVTIDTISYSSNGDVILGGRGQAGNFVRIYLDNQFLATSKIAADGYWALELSDIEPGIYTLRVDELNAAGDVVSRAETPFKREAAEELAELMAAGTETEEPSAEGPSESAAETQVVDAEALASVEPEAADDPQTEEVVTQEEVNVQAEVAELNPQGEQSSDGGSLAVEGQPADTASVLRTPSKKFRVRTVQPGSTLWAIAKESYGAGIEYFKVFEANKERIRDPDLIYPGQVFEIPD